MYPPAVVVKMGLVFVAAADMGALGFDVAADGGGRVRELSAIGLWCGFCVIKRAMQGANRSKVGYLARIGNVAEAAL